MRISYALFSLLILVVSAAFNQLVAAAVLRANAVRIPEHTCHKVFDINICDLQKCKEECSKQPLGVGQCRNASCSCIYYCKQPPLV